MFYWQHEVKEKSTIEYLPNETYSEPKETHLEKLKANYNFGPGPLPIQVRVQLFFFCPGPLPI